MSPYIGQRVRLYYRESNRQNTPHGSGGEIVTLSNGRPKNALVRLDDGRVLTVPIGNLSEEPKNVTTGTHYGQQISAGLGVSTVLADIDFETYSEAGFLWNELTRSYVAPKGATEKGLFAVGARVYAEHPTAEALMLAYDLKDGLGPRQWLQGGPPPVDLFEHIKAGRLLAAWNCQFEYWIWNLVCVPKYGWPELPYWILRDDMAKSRAHAWPGALKNAAKVSGASVQKLAGSSLINLFCVPRKPTKNNPSRRVHLRDRPAKAVEFAEYNVVDIVSEASVSAICPDLSPGEQEFELYTRKMNIMGIALDMGTIRAACSILDQAYERYDAELHELTGGAVDRASELDKIKAWMLSEHSLATGSLDSEHTEKLLAGYLPDPVRRALEIRQLVGSAGVKKYYALERMASLLHRIHDLFVYHGARTGRDTGQDAQPQNLVKNGPRVKVCENCNMSYGAVIGVCPFCGAGGLFAHERPWSYEYVDDAVAAIRTGSLDAVENFYGDALLTLSGCLRGMFVPAPGHDFICSDYSSIEAVVAAVIAGEKWRIEAFERKEDIYLHSASRTTGIPFEEYVRYAAENGQKHPDRGKIGKPQELGLGFGGWVAAWRVFDSSDTFTDDEVKRHILVWRAASPAIVEMWGGQVRGKPWAPDYYERYGLGGAAVNAVEYPGRCFEYRRVTYGVKDDVLYCRLPSGRFLTYHKPRLSASEKWDGQLALSFEGWNSNPKMGPIGWIRIKTFGGRLFENVVQAIARDILAHAVVNLEKAGYPIVLRVHDELVAEVPEGFGSIEEFETIMGAMPEWAAGWPVRAAGGWRAKRYRKD